MTKFIEEPTNAAAAERFGIGQRIEAMQAGLETSTRPGERRNSPAPWGRQVTWQLG